MEVVFSDVASIKDIFCTYMENEIWKDVPWWEWMYEVSNYWRLKSLSRFVKNRHWYRKMNERIITWSPDGFWYLQFSLSNGWKYSQIRAHRLVWIVFMWIDRSNIDICVLHKDDNPKNNRLDNLFLWTRTDNARDREMKWRWKFLSWKENYFFWRKWKDHHSSIPIVQYSLSWNFIREWESATEVERELWFCRTSIQICWYYWRRCKQSNWFLWRYKNQEIPHWLRIIIFP